jgi:hypothetical protein
VVGQSYGVVQDPSRRTEGRESEGDVIPSSLRSE